MAKFATIMTIGNKAKRDETRPAHRVYLKQLFDAGKLLESGPFTDGEGALFIYECANEAEVRDILARDPYTLAGDVVASVDIREWNRVIPPV